MIPAPPRIPSVEREGPEPPLTCPRGHRHGPERRELLRKEAGNSERGCRSLVSLGRARDPPKAGGELELV